MQKRIFGLLALSTIIAVGFYAWWAARASHAARVTPGVAQGATQAPGSTSAPSFQPRAIKKAPPNPYTGPAFNPDKKYPPGTYTPAGFAADYRERIVREFGHFSSSRLGYELDEARAKKVADVQNKFWDEHGPDVDLFDRGRISQQEFSERAHQHMIAFASQMEPIFTDEEYQKVFDVPKGTDTFYVLAHSPTEQPGMRFQAENPGPPNLSVMAQPAAGAVDNDSPPPPPTNDKYPKAGK
jgi:hypothetical protein